MTKIIINAKIYTGQTVIENGFIRFNEQIAELNDMSNYQAIDNEEVIDVKGQILVPGFIDIHSHGGYGADSMDADPKVIDEMTKRMLREGITSYFPTTMTQSDENIENALAGIKEAKSLNPMIQGIHLEGPLFHPNTKEHNRKNICVLRMLKRWSGGMI